MFAKFLTGKKGGGVGAGAAVSAIFLSFPHKAVKPAWLGPASFVEYCMSQPKPMVT